MKKYYSYFWFFILTIYCVILISIEVKVSQDFVRNFFIDIQGSVPFYAINTSLSVFLLLATALIFSLILATLSSIENNSQNINFYRSQVVFFGYLGLDDRFLIHEYLGHVLGINDALILAGLGVVEIILILTWGNYRQWSRTTINYLLGAAVFSALMILIDGAFPREMIPRLSLEDLSKTWANTFILLFAWSIFSQNINIIKLKAQQYDALSREDLNISEYSKPKPKLG
ncbi:hypothetical protein I4641_19295 [Waterburya agarophytonicola K14]|uniref:Uncharacterized protein n=1 Tax=Waterburya agarophytonicola KI4 TaxID=2874699 RepID=A0A964BSZ9_9CYAN|nr:hypothetical protein [Waterburya agarophytonicola]MCC0179118.1 hypothetical protein [Waterburya agarophytonicola KI4]